MPLLPFLVYSTLGTLLWVGLLTYAGYILGSNYPLIERFIDPIFEAGVAGVDYQPNLVDFQT